MNRYGDTPLGMVESALEFARIAPQARFSQFQVLDEVVSNPKVMIECYRLLVARLDELGPDWNYPIHLGVTEAGEGEDGRIKSAIGIGSLLCDGLGDTIRVSLTEDSPHEIAVCTDLLAQIPLLTNSDVQNSRTQTLPFDPFHFERRETPEIELNDRRQMRRRTTVRVVVTRATWDKVAPKIRPKDDVKPEAVYEDLNIAEIDPTQDFEINCDTQLVTVKDGVTLAGHRRVPFAGGKIETAGPQQSDSAQRLHHISSPCRWNRRSPCCARRWSSARCWRTALATRFWFAAKPAAGKSLRLAYNILQAAGCRSFKTDYVACPSCGRTLFNLQTVTARIKARTEHLKGVKIAIMGCIVNGPGEMADADFGYVGGAPEQDQSLRRQDADQVQHPRSRGRGTPGGPDQGTQQMGRAGNA